jgi:hypothetical protein
MQAYIGNHTNEEQSEKAGCLRENGGFERSYMPCSHGGNDIRCTPKYCDDHTETYAQKFHCRYRLLILVSTYEWMPDWFVTSFRGFFHASPMKLSLERIEILFFACILKNRHGANESIREEKRRNLSGT